MKNVDNPSRNNIEKSMKQKKANSCQLINHKECLLNYHSFQYFTFMLIYIYIIFLGNHDQYFVENKKIINEWQRSFNENDR